MLILSSKLLFIDEKHAINLRAFFLFLSLWDINFKQSIT